MMIFEFRRLRFSLLGLTVLATGCATFAPNSLPDAAAVAPAHQNAATAPASTREIHTVLASAGPTTATEKLGCPGAGVAECEDNWNLVETGWSQQQVIDQLGEPSGESDPQIYIHQVLQEWHYEDGVIEFRNELVSGVAQPGHFGFPAKRDPLQQPENTAG